ncbi:YsnF/AvaK domain-containing protein [Pontibacter ruber]|uniref:YsnF/AvaK domain-containing protein n=1 Tax=Pontibacter ruber TaxID=1343895 RepID=A0ABW5CZD2_9BACT|nr:YsnF/AvaK domain-containing protein [Pontibacter ruber]
MAQTVIGIFEKGVDAQTAVQKLETNRINPGNIDISNQSSASAVGTATRTDSDKIGNFFGSLFGNNDEARKHTEVARKGWVVTVHADSQQEAERAADILDTCGAVDVDERSAQVRNTQATGSATNLNTGTTTTGGTTDRTIPIIEERMQVGKENVETGGIRMRSRIVERPVEEHLRLREEHVHVERHPVNRPATERDIQNFKEGEATITEHAERAIVNKEARVVEEIKIGKHTEEHDETIRGSVRKTNVEVDKLRPGTEQRRPGMDPKGPAGK